MYKQNTFIIYKLYSKVSPDGQLYKMDTPPAKMDMRVGPFLLYSLYFIFCKTCTSSTATPARPKDVPLREGQSYVI